MSSQALPLDPLTALSPLDGRYAAKLAALREHFSELGLIRARVRVEIAWLRALSDEPAIREVPPFSPAALERLDRTLQGFGIEDARRIKDIERVTNHDVKAIEYWLKEKLAAGAEVQRVAEFIHFACTSEDINNLSHALMLRSALEADLLPSLSHIVQSLRELAHGYAEVPMLARTHGQPAT